MALNATRETSLIIYRIFSCIVNRLVLLIVLMDDGPRNIDVVPDHFQASTSESSSPGPSTSQQKTDKSLRIGPAACFGLEEE